MKSKIANVLSLLRTLKFADWVSTLRAPATLAVIILSIHRMWPLAFIAWSAGWATDLFDGVIAHRFGSRRRPDPNSYIDSKPDSDIDGKADSVLAFGSTLVPAVYLTGHYSFGWLAIVAWIATGISALVMISIMDKKPVRPVYRRIIMVNMLVFHGLIQIGLTTLWFAYMAYGWGGVAMTFVVLVGVSIGQIDKIRLWWGGALR